MLRKSIFGLIAIAVLAVIGVGLHAQGSGGQTAFSFIPGPLANCPTPDATHDSYCDVTGVGLEIAVAGSGGYVPFGQTAPVTSVFGRKGPVVAAPGDYSFAQLTGTATASQLPATLSCNATINTPAQATFTINTMVQTSTISLSACK